MGVEGGRSSVTGQCDKKDALFVFGSAATVCTVQIQATHVNHVFPVLSGCGCGWVYRRKRGGFSGTQWSL